MITWLARQGRNSSLYSSVLITVLAGVAVAGAAAEPVALVLEVAGEVTPPIEAFGEIEAGSAYELGAASRLEFLHYPTCQRVIVEGGRLNLSSENFRVNKGKVIDMSRAECPQRVQLASTDTGAGIGGVVLRSGAASETLQVSQRPSFMLRGAFAGKYNRLQVMQGELVVLDAALAQKPLTWPETLAALQAGGAYTVRLAGPDGAASSIPLAVGKQSKQAVPAIIRAD